MIQCPQNLQSANEPHRRAGLLTAAAVVAGGTHAYADPVRFDNVGQAFVWNGQHLDVTRPYSLQPNTAGSASVFQHVEVTPHPYGYDPLIAAWADGSAKLAQTYHYGYMASWWTSVTVSSGASVNGSMNFSGGNMTVFAGWAFLPNRNWFRYLFVPKNGIFYLPMRFKDGTDAHYGWIAGEWRGVDGVQALAWGYETTPNTAIAAGAVPAPGTLAALAFGAVALGRRPKRGTPRAHSNH